MTKYIRKDDRNDDNEAYRGETFPNLTYSRFKHQQLKQKGKRDEMDIKQDKLINSLSDRQKQLYKLVVEDCLSVNEAAQRMKIKQQTAQEYWSIIKLKMSKTVDNAP